MPELPEVEVVRRGLERWVVGRTIGSAAALHPRAVRRHLAGADDFADHLAGRTVIDACRRGKFLWLPLDDGLYCLSGHLGMSGQMLVQPPDAADETHLRVRITFTDGGTELRFVDQRTFGGLAVEPLARAMDGGQVPLSATHIARDPLDPKFDNRLFLTNLLAKRTGVKRALLDQTLVSGVGNIYADESLWRARLHGEHPADGLTRQRAGRLLSAARTVMTEALAAGGTSFDALYVNVNGQSGYFSRALNAYGRGGLPCERCKTPIERVSFMNRSSYFCPRCQAVPKPRAALPSD
ncbi:MAG TPA: bifunctional DNA-formamidopyrimidine glycosylase/DNA-(apurinic or apyrimidinic site) lyase [Actinocrinis sp.]|nr:bifunctional DNA-formamidopyrimidine glycosylase/DNA-(apurinic or apyrimidinic site) lyase [Actinocrinis sp.]